MYPSLVLSELLGDTHFEAIAVLCNSPKSLTLLLYLDIAYMKHLYSLVLGTWLSLTSLMAQSPTTNEASCPRILVETSKGKFVLELFNETPKHRDNFLRLAREGKYDGTIFHRVIKGFMVQGGNLLSTGKKASEEIPEDSVIRNLPAEFHPELFVHTRGILAAARQPDEMNPKKESSGSQFYIVTGKYYTSLDLREASSQHGYTYNEEQSKAYMTESGAAHLDGSYTVFGRVLEGYPTLDKIQRVETDEDDRPLKNVTIKRMTLLP